MGALQELNTEEPPELHELGAGETVNDGEIAHIAELGTRKVAGHTAARPWRSQQEPPGQGHEHPEAKTFLLEQPSSATY